MNDTPRTDAVFPFRKEYFSNGTSALYRHQSEQLSLCQELERENAALREDKARLDWLDCKGRNIKNVNMDGIWREWSHRDYVNTKATLRESIDAARKEAQP